MKRSRLRFGLFSISILLVIAAFVLDSSFKFNLQQIATHSTQRIEERAQQCKQGLSLLATGNHTAKWEALTDLYNEERIGLYLWKRDSLVFWNNAQIPLRQDTSAFPRTSGLAKLPQGYYLYFKEASANGTALALCLVKPSYELQNNHLRNHFRDWTGIPRDVKMDTTNRSPFKVALEGKALFAIKGSQEIYYTDWAEHLSFVLFFAGFILLLTTFLFYVKAGASPTGLAFSVIAILGLRLFMVLAKWPAFFYRSVLYDLQTFGNAESLVNGYLGDILLNAVTCMAFAAVFHFYPRNPAASRYRFSYGLLLVLATFVAYNQFNQTAVTLISNSTLSFDFLSIFNIKFQAFVGLACLAIYALALFILVSRTLYLFEKANWKNALLFLLIYLGICVLQQLVVQREGLLENYWLLAFAAVMLLLLRLLNVKVALALGVQIVLMSLVTSGFLNKYITRNQEQDLEILSMKLSEKQDAILENEFDEIPAKMAEDKPLNTLFQFLADIPTAEKEATLLLKQKYFGGYFDRYTLQFSLFDKNCVPLLSVKDPRLLNEGFFEDQIRNFSDTIFPGRLFFVKNYRSNAQYIGKIDLGDKNLYVLMEPKQFEELGSFPDLLLDQSQQKPEKLKSFSHAVYRSQQITSRYGDFNYPFALQDSASLTTSDPGFVHHYYRPDENTLVIISEKTKDWSYFFTFNSYLLLFFSLVTYMFYLLYSAFFSGEFGSPTLTRRIQAIIVVLLLLAMSSVGFTSAHLVSRQFEKDNLEQLEEKTQVIINELTGQFTAEQFFDPSQKELINLKLKEYSRLFTTPISLFARNGSLFNTSESKLYDLGLAAPLANPKAFWKLNNNQSSSESVTDRAGSLKYLSLYTPLFDEKKQLAGFINLPYFARQSDLANELSGIISALMNVYVILFVISILAGLILSGFITQPLRLIKHQLSNVTFGRTNEKITWHSNDEIGKLVSEYNQMLVKLEQSAEMLAKSERESAWREMAKQVAHEIKNPLTPMKLNLQYLQHLMKSDAADFREKFERASAGIIEQIDSLASIANEFSHFARLPGARLEAINLSEVIASSVLIFGNHETVRIHNHITQEELMVKGDREQCLRVFNNILKNAVQALDGVPEPRIDINLEQKNHAVVIAIKDNGCGIDEAQRPKIFSPNFTTKSTGSGLGLAMVKNIMLGFGGNISFTSEKNKGTTFYLEFVFANTRAD